MANNSRFPSIPTRWIINNSPNRLIGNMEYRKRESETLETYSNMRKNREKAKGKQEKGQGETGY